MRWFVLCMLVLTCCDALNTQSEKGRSSLLEIDYNLISAIKNKDTTTLVKYFGTSIYLSAAEWTEEIKLNRKALREFHNKQSKIYDLLCEPNQVSIVPAANPVITFAEAILYGKAQVVNDRTNQLTQEGGRSLYFSTNIPGRGEFTNIIVMTCDVHQKCIVHELLAD